jgi:hypothetical protein
LKIELEGYRFGTAINCIDGRTQQPLIDYMKKNFSIDGIDIVTFPGADGIFSDKARTTEVTLARRAVSVSVEKHGSEVIAIAGHHDCAGNPGDASHHYSQITKATREISLWNLHTVVIGLYLNEKWRVEKVL